MIRKFTAILIVLALLAVTLGACAKKASTPSPSPTKPPTTTSSPTPTATTPAEKKYVTFGTIWPLTGPVAALGSSMDAGADLAIEEINTKWNAPLGGIIVNGQRYYLKRAHYDDAADPAKSPVGFRKLVEQYDPPFIIGPLGTPHSWAVSPVSLELKQLFEAFSASDKTRRLDNPYLFQSRPPANYMGAPMAEAAFAKGWKKYAIIADVSEAYTSWAQAFQDRMDKLGGTLIGKEVVDTKTTTDYRSIMTKLNAGKPDVILLLAYEEPNATMVLHAREVGYKGFFFGNDNFTQMTIGIAGAKNVAGSLVDAWPTNYYVDHPEEPGAAAVTYLYGLYKSKYPGKPWHNLVPTVWNDTLLFAKAMEVAGSVTDDLKIRRALDAAARLIRPQSTQPYTGVLPEGVMTGWTDILAEILPDGTMKKVGELVTPTEVLRIYANPADAPLNKLP